MRRALVLAVAVVLLAGCQLRADVDVVVGPDGSGTLAISLEIDPALAAEARAAGFDFTDTIATRVDGLDGWEVRADERRAELSTTFADPGELREISTAFAEALSGPELRPLEPVEVTLTDERIGFAAAAALQPTEAANGLGLDAQEAAALLRDSVIYTISVELPGEILDHNADREDVGRLSWQVPAGEHVELRASAERPADPFPPSWLAATAVGAGLVAIGGALVLGLRRRRLRRRRRRGDLFLR